ncbi:hypothetical protein SADUNF_Sadunf17G0137300 [Salix dunnii]|uniref:Uncharacterized protein n=1 Tax=Salix dunnii TaxID=1413687 RepID=A0A835J743_9ROSI|nr:hypothetical protein SADUNF_Sadunf17G0137300 [Salix dunnii]
MDPSLDKKYQDLCDHSNLSLTRLQTLTIELELICQENADLKVTNNGLVKLVRRSFQASVMQHQHRTLGNNCDVSFERKNNANNMGTKRVTLSKKTQNDKSRKNGEVLEDKQGRHKAVIARSFDDGTCDHTYDHWLVAGLKKYPSKVNEAISCNVSNNGCDRGSANSNSTRSRMASPLDQLASTSCM